MLQIEVAEILTIVRERVTHQTKARLSGNKGELQVELLTGDVLVGVDMQGGSKFHDPSLKYLLQFILMEGSGRWDGYRLVACR